MNLTTAQLQTMKADIAANGDLNMHPNTPDGNQQIANKYNLNAAPSFTVWKTSVGVTQIGDAFNGAELANLTQLNVARLQVQAQYAPGGVNPSLADRRAFFADIFSSAPTTNAALVALWRRLATRGEKLYAVGTGSDSSPATMSLTGEGAVTNTNVQQARDLP